MSNPNDATGQKPSSDAADARTRRWFWLVPAVTFLVGLVLGGAVIAATKDGTDNGGAPSAAPTVTTSPSPTITPTDRTITVPASCERAVERARTAMNTTGEAVQALRDLNTARLQRLLDQLQDAQREVERLAEQCRREVPARN